MDTVPRSARTGHRDSVHGLMVAITVGGSLFLSLVLAELPIRATIPFNTLDIVRDHAF